MANQSSWALIVNSLALGERLATACTNNQGAAVRVSAHTHPHRELPHSAPARGTPSRIAYVPVRDDAVLGCLLPVPVTQPTNSLCCQRSARTVWLCRVRLSSTAFPARAVPPLIAAFLASLPVTRLHAHNLKLGKCPGRFFARGK